MSSYGGFVFKTPSKIFSLGQIVCECRKSGPLTLNFRLLLALIGELPHLFFDPKRYHYLRYDQLP